MDKPQHAAAIDEHSKAEGQLEKAEGAIEKGLRELRDVSRHMKEKIADEKREGRFPIDDDPPGDVEEGDQPRASNPLSVCSVRTASSAYSSSVSTENFISEVVIARMFTPLSASALKARAATPVWERMPTPIAEIFTTSCAPCSAP
jgi:hypothetical protein